MSQTFNPMIPGPSPEEPYRSFIHQFLMMLYQDGHSKRTVVSYGWHINKRSIWLEQQGVANPEQLGGRNDIELGGIFAYKIFCSNPETIHCFHPNVFPFSGKNGLLQFNSG